MTLPKNNTRRNTALIFMAVSIFLAIHRRASGSSIPTPKTIIGESGS
jgi:hypothetical protein